MKHFLCPILMLALISCYSSTKKEEVLNDIISYNKAIFNISVSNCSIIDNDASCAGKTESYLISCDETSDTFKWDKMHNFQSGEDEIYVFLIPKNESSYHCNPELNYKKKYQGHKKNWESWVANNYND